MQFLLEKLVDAGFGPVLHVEHVDDSDVDQLAVAMAATDTLLDPLRIPRKIIVYQTVAAPSSR